jgi:PhnB protein
MMGAFPSSKESPVAAILTPYVNFKDTARQALEFYQSVFGGEIQALRFADFGASDDPAEADKLMHGQLDTPSGFTFMMADTPNRMEWNPTRSFSISLSGDMADYDELVGYWDRLSASASVISMPFGQAPWGAHFGMCIDQFGVPWIVNITADQPSA